ncbi:non-canonical purine NTP pyrophosphatase [Philodulcilactobacillus myokoensis]|uniref:dITP/XTP pyrophosphatase n=2 Tax=Philodulcilactobacillus myokoensis TaxID=2929573 RepID=A0A9W6B1J2_9LACO|nr:XTP/dITP diphosphatase [Philodulcilactobacillus myokoensis]GLB46693.1 non-canonical purine NTP pyrophosphatase [Philodulcilactobacillus myokoensis]
MNEIVIASRNQNKIKEYRKMFAEKGFNVKSTDDFLGIPTVKETGKTFEENATLKAEAMVRHTKLPVIADDSGLEVKSLNNEPGIYSARYAGDHDDQANNRKLLSQLSNFKNRDAKFVTWIVMMKPNFDKLVVHGELNGEILKSKRGRNGFGYDPLFYVSSKKKSLAEMTMSEKNSISHRGRALRKLLEKFDEFWDK